MSTQTQPTVEDDTTLRSAAIARLKKRADFKVHLLVYVLVNSCVVVIWATTGAGFFWPVFPMVAWGIGVVMNGWDAYRREVPTESQIQHEMTRMRGHR